MPGKLTEQRDSNAHSRASKDFVQLKDEAVLFYDNDWSCDLLALDL